MGEFQLAMDIRRKLVSWWNGYDFIQANSAPILLNKSQAGHAPTEGGYRPSISVRARVLQELWGAGNITPSSEALIRRLTVQLGLTAEMNMLDMGAGLGGPARAIYNAYGTWVTGYEDTPEIAEAGMEQSVKHGVSKKVPIILVDFETVERPRRMFDRFFSKETFHRVRGKGHLLIAVEAALKPLGQFVITEYVMAEGANHSHRIAEWNKAEVKERVSHFWTRQGYTVGFDRAKLDLRVAEDLTSQHMELINDGFCGLSKKIDALIEGEKNPEMQGELRRALAFESRRWEARAEALRVGDIAVMRLSGITRLQPEIR